MTERVAELRSDTFTRPSDAMREAMARAEVGDDVWNEDPTVHELERRSAELMGKEAALFVSSGTQGNLIGVLTHTQRGDEIILGDRSHIFRYEVSGTAVVGGLQTRTLPNNSDGTLGPELVASSIRGSDIHEPHTGCLALENTHNGCSGSVLSLAMTESLAGIAHRRDVPVHLDGARIFNAAEALGVSADVVAAPADSVTFCLSKGLGAPVGSVLCGAAPYIARARKWRKMLGGGMRQAGILAAAGLFALEFNRQRLAEDHANARALAEGLGRIPGVDIDLDRVQSNLVFFAVPGIKLSHEEFVELVGKHGVKIATAGPRLRAVTSSEVDRADIEYALAVMADVAQPATAVAV